MFTWTVQLGTEIKPTKLDWLWPRYLPRGKLTLLDGDPGLGKSLIAIDLMARLSRGAPLPDGSPVAGPHKSLYLSAEDDAADTICPRAEAAGAEMNRLLIAARFDGPPPTLRDNLHEFQGLVLGNQISLMVFDPLMAFLPPEVAANLDQCVRTALTPLTQLAAQTGCAVLAIRHPAKREASQAILRGQGSIGIAAAARAAWLVGAHPCDRDRRVLALTKTNVGRRPPALGYRIIESASGVPVVEWTGPVDLTADDLSRAPEGRVRAAERALDWLRRELANGPRKAAELYAAAAAAGIPERTLERIKSELPARSHRAWDAEAGRAEWYWYDPSAPWPTGTPFERPEDLRRPESPEK
jgi:hypothetical protein